MSAASPKLGAPRKFTDTDAARMKVLVGVGYSYSHVARLMGCTAPTVKLYVDQGFRARNSDRAMTWYRSNRDVAAVQMAHNTALAKQQRHAGHKRSDMTVKDFKVIYEWPKCQSCGVETTLNTIGQPRQREIHHILPISKGGLHNRDNVKVLCHECHVQAHRDLRAAERQAA